jgi:hypothetical protein
MPRCPGKRYHALAHLGDMRQAANDPRGDAASAELLGQADEIASGPRT